VSGKKPHYHVTAGVIRRNGRVLISKRPEASHMGGYWEFPGGKQEPGESLRACLEREIREELGFTIRTGDAFPPIRHEYETRSITLHPFYCVPGEGLPRALGCDEIRWVRPCDLGRFLFAPPDRKIVRRVMVPGRRNILKEQLEERAMFYRKNDSDFRELLDGVRMKTLVYGAKSLLSEFRLEKGKQLPVHRHPHEQTGYLVSGRINVIIGDEIFKAEPGDGWNIPGDVDHGAEVLADSVVVEVFSPLREDYLP